MLKLILKRSVVTLPVVAVSLVALLGAGNSAKAQVISYDGFNYPAGTGNAGDTGGDSTGWGGPWASSTAGSQIQTNTASGLTYGDLTTDGGALQVGAPQPGAPIGTATAAVAQRLLPDTLGDLAAANGGSLWLSFLIYNPAYPTNTAASIYNRQSNLGFFSGATSGGANGSEKSDLGLDNTSATVAPNFATWGGTISASTPNMSTVSAFSGSVQFVLIEMFVDQTTAVDTYYAWFNLNPSTFSINADAPSISTANLTNSGADLTSVNALRFQAGGFNANGTNAFYTVDEIDLGDSFASVTPTPEPATMTLAAIGGTAALLALRRRRKQ
jgi:hypothetical protein